jgi:hypothetical protein
MFNVYAVAEQFGLNCPCCGRAVLIALPEKSEVPGGGTWLQDGDTIPGLWDQLTDAQKAPSSFDYELMIGTCPGCQQQYYAVLCNWMQGDYAELEDYLLRNVPLNEERNYVCVNEVDMDGVPRQWLMQEYRTEKGPMQEHWFGPFKLDDDEGVVGPFGVSACSAGDNDAWKHASKVLMALWDDLRAHSQRRHAEVVAA